MRPLVPLVLLMASAGCHHRNPEQTAAQDTRDIARVKAAQRTIPPPVPFAPQPVSFADLDAPATQTHIPTAVGKPAPGEGCDFVPAVASAATPPVVLLVAVPKFALAKRDGKLVLFAADSGSPDGAAGLHGKYAGGEYALDLSQGETIGAGGVKAAVTIRDSYDRIVYFSAGELRCHAQPPGPAPAR